MLLEEQYDEVNANGGMINHNEKGEPTPTNPEQMPDTVYIQLVITLDYDTYK